MNPKLIIFLETLAFIGAVAFFAGGHKEHLRELEKTLERIEQSAKASEAAAKVLRMRSDEVERARVEIDKKLLEVPAGDMCYEYYGRLLREDACRRASAGSADGVAGSVPGAR